MAFMTLNGVTLPVASRRCRETRVEYGDRTPAFSGAARKSVRGIKRVWECSTKGLSYADYEGLRGLIQGQGWALPFDEDSGTGRSYLNTSNGLPPDAVSTSLPYFQTTWPLLGLSAQVAKLTATPATNVFGFPTKFPNFTSSGSTWFGPGTTNMVDETVNWVNGTPTLVTNSYIGGGVREFVRNSTAGHGFWWTSIFSGLTAGNPFRVSFVHYPVTGFTASTQFAIDFFTAGFAYISTITGPTISNAAANPKQVTFGGIVPATATKFLISANDVGSVPSYSFYLYQIQAEQMGEATAYTPSTTVRSGGSYMQFNLDSYNLARTGFTVLCWTPISSLLCPDRTGLWCMGETTAEDTGTSGQHRLGIQFEAASANARFKIRGTDNDVAVSRSGMTFKLLGYRYDPSSATPQHLIVDGAVASQLAAGTLDLSAIKRLYISGTQVSGGVVTEPAWTYIDDFQFYPYPISDGHLAAIAAATATPTGVPEATPARGIHLNGDVVGSPSGSVLVTGKVNSGNFSPRALSGTWKKNVREMDFTLTEM